MYVLPALITVTLLISMNFEKSLSLSKIIIVLGSIMVLTIIIRRTDNHTMWRTVLLLSIFLGQFLMLLSEYECENHDDFELKSLLTLLSFVSIHGLFLPFELFIIPLCAIYSTSFWMGFHFSEKKLTFTIVLKFTCYLL